LGVDLESFAYCNDEHARHPTRGGLSREKVWGNIYQLQVTREAVVVN